MSELSYRECLTENKAYRLEGIDIVVLDPHRYQRMLIAISNELLLKDLSTGVKMKGFTFNGIEYIRYQQI